MARYRSFFFAEACVDAESLTLDARESHHLIRVLRAKSGETVEVLDGKGTRYLGRIATVDAKAVRVELDSFDNTQAPRPRVTLLQSIPKGKAMDLILRMATEIGATCVQPVFSEQGEVQMKGKRLISKTEKWRLTMIESCKQCGLAYLPELAKPSTLAEWVNSKVRLPTTTKAGVTTLNIVASLEEGSRPLFEILEAAGEFDEVTVAVGPEGDFTAGEYASLAAAGFQSVRLGANVLRAETATAYILSVIDQCASKRYRL